MPPALLRRTETSARLRTILVEMADPNTIALVSVVVTGCTAVFAPVVAAWRDGAREKRRFRHERTISDLTELRTLLDETAARLGEVIAVLDVRDGIQPEQRFALLVEHRRLLLRDLGRIAVRLGSDDPALLVAEDATTSVERLVRLLSPHDDDASDPFEAIVEAYEDLDRAREDFYDAAERVVGARVERTSDPWTIEPSRTERMADGLWRLRRRRTLRAMQGEAAEASAVPGSAAP